MDIPSIGYIQPPEPDIERALNILKQYSNQIDSFKVCISLFSTLACVGIVNYNCKLSYILVRIDYTRKKNLLLESLGGKFFPVSFFNPLNGYIILKIWL